MVQDQILHPVLGLVQFVSIYFVKFVNPITYHTHQADIKTAGLPSAAISLTVATEWAYCMRERGAGMQ